MSVGDVGQISFKSPNQRCQGTEQEKSLTGRHVICSSDNSWHKSPSNDCIFDKMANSTEMLLWVGWAQGMMYYMEIQIPRGKWDIIFGGEGGQGGTM